MIEILSSSIKSHPSTPRVALIGFSNEIELQLRDAFAFEFGLVASSFDSQESLNISDEYPSGTIKFACVCDEVTILDFRKNLRLEFAVVCKNFITAKAAAWIEKGAAAVYSLEHHSAPEIAQLVAAHLRVVAQSKSRLPKSTQEHSSNAQIEWTKDLEIVRWSEGAEQILGFAARHVAGRSLGEWLFPAGKMRDFLSKASSLDESSIGKFSACCRTRCFDGSFLKTNWRLAPVANEFGSVTSILGICEPLTGATEESSRAEDLNSLAISEDQDAGLWDHDIENGRLFWSPNLFKRFGLGFYETTPSFRSYLGRIPQDDRRRLWRSYLDCIQGKANSFTLIYRMKNTGDQWRYYHAKVEVKQRSSKGRVSRVVGSDIDVTRYINATEELRFAKHTVDNSSSGILLANARGQIIYHNEAVNRMLGYTSDELGEISIGEVDPHLVPPPPRNKKAPITHSGPGEKVKPSKNRKNKQVEV
ncbi:MAG: PAS domain-containing protein, partial [Verrucomicrobiota bacterium]